MGILNKIRNSSKFKKYHRLLKLHIADKFYNNHKYLPEGIDRIYHYHIRKSAGTSINASFWNLEGFTLASIGREPIVLGKRRSYVLHQAPYIENRNYFYASSHFPMWQLNLPPQTFTFTILRDPYERLVSLYKYYKWVEITDVETGYKFDTSFDVLKKQTYLLNKSFDSFMDALSVKYLYGNLYMFSEGLNVEVALENLKKVSKVYFQDQLTFAFNDLRDTLGQDLKIPEPQRKFDNTNFSISNQEKTKALELLKDEIDFYNRARIIFSRGK